MTRKLVERLRNRARASKKAVSQSVDDIEAAMQKMRPPIMRHEPLDSGGITRERFLDVVKSAAK